MSDKIEGRNPVIEALRSGREIDKIYVKTGESSLGKIIKLAKDRGIIVQEASNQRLDTMSETRAHQGVIAQTAVHEYSSVSAILQRAKDKGESPFVIICDKLTDPHNLGSIIRTANAAGAHGVIIPKHESVGLNASVGKSSAGAFEFTPVARVTNLSQTIDTLKKEGLWIIGADADGDKSIYKADFKGAVAIVVGNEGEGISRLLKEKCDFLVSIPMMGEISSLNASVAAALMLYEVVRSRNL